MTWQDYVQRYVNSVGEKTPIQKTGFCNECERLVKKGQPCPKSLPSPESNLSPICPMKKELDSAEKMAGAITTTSAPSMFNNKVVNPKRRKKEDE